MIECTVCDRSHVWSHPHIANIDGDEPVDHEPMPTPSTGEPIGPRPIGRADLPDWLKDKPGAQAIRPATSTNSDADPHLCQVCGEPWAPKHACKGAEQPGTDFNRPIKSAQAICETCGKIKRSNHKCKGLPGGESPRTTEPPEPTARDARSVPGSNTAVTVAGQHFEVIKLTASELKRMKQRKPPSKYQEILDMLMGLDIGEAILVPVGKVSADGLRGQARKLPDRTFVSHLDDLHLTIIRSK